MFDIHVADENSHDATGRYRRKRISAIKVRKLMAWLAFRILLLVAVILLSVVIVAYTIGWDS